jgi:hypothetical protein
MCGQEYGQQQAWHHLQTADLNPKLTEPGHKTVRDLAAKLGQIAQGLQRGVACLPKR